MRSLHQIFESFKFNGTEIRYPYIIAEAGVNHEGKMDIAKKLVDEAAEGGANAIKFQTYKAETLASKNSPSYWDLSQESTTSQFDLFKKYDKFWKNEFEQLKVYCDQVGIEFMSTPFDLESAAFLNDLMNVFKISSSDLSNHPFIEEICSYRKPIILSTGASFTWEIQEVVELILKHNINFCLMHCVLNYPTPNDQANLGFILDLKQKFPEAIIGYSDHTLPGEMENLKVAALLGAEIIEKHFTHDKVLPGNDHYHSMDKEDLKLVHAKLKETFSLIGSFRNTVNENELVSRQNARRSLVASKDIRKGELFSLQNLTWKRPGVGISPKYLGDILGKEANENLRKDDIIYWNKIIL